MRHWPKVNFALHFWGFLRPICGTHLTETFVLPNVPMRTTKEATMRRRCVSVLHSNVSGCKALPEPNIRLGFRLQGIGCDQIGPQFKNNYFTKMCSGSEEGSYLRLRLLHHSTLGLRVIKKKK